MTCQRDSTSGDINRDDLFYVQWCLKEYFAAARHKHHRVARHLIANCTIAPIGSCSLHRKTVRNWNLRSVIRANRLWHSMCFNMIGDVFVVRQETDHALLGSDFLCDRAGRGGARPWWNSRYCGQHRALAICHISGAIHSFFDLRFRTSPTRRVKKSRRTRLRTVST